MPNDKTKKKNLKKKPVSKKATAPTKLTKTIFIVEGAGSTIRFVAKRVDPSYRLKAGQFATFGEAHAAANLLICQEIDALRVLRHGLWSVTREGVLKDGGRKEKAKAEAEFRRRIAA
jgi:hypothetical protein